MSDSEMLPSSLTPTLPETLPSESLTRRSARIQGRRPKKDSFANLEYKVNRKWKDCEKILLARAVRSNGSRNIGVISEKIRTRSESEVRTFMDKERTKQEFESVSVPAGELTPKARSILTRRHRNSPIEIWIRTTERLIRSKAAVDGQELIFILENISSNEDHPPMRSKKDVDYAAIYRALADYMRGEVPKQMNSETSSKLLEMLQKLKEFYKDNQEAFNGISKFISTNFVSSDSRDGQSDLLNISVNPLQFPSSVLSIRSTQGVEKNEP